MSPTAIERSAELQRRVFAEVSDAIVVFDAATARILDSNPAATRLFGWTREELLDLSIPDLAADPENARATVASMARRVAGVLRPRIAVRKDGSHFPVDIRFDQFPWRGGTACVAMVRDHSRRQRADDYLALKLRESIVRESLLSMSHELRTPIAAIKAFADGLRTGAVPEAQRRQFVNGIARQSERLAALVDHSLVLAMSEEAARNIRGPSTDLAAGVKETVADLQAWAGRRKVRLTACVPERMDVAIDRLELFRILQNLIGNGIKHNRPGGRLRVCAERAGSEALVCVCDDGPGIPPSELPRVFDRFYRGEAARRREVRGLGLGLSLVRELVEACGGTVWAESREGKGASFWVLLPLVRDPRGSSRKTLQLRDRKPASTIRCACPGTDAVTTKLPTGTNS
ncbi:MAG: PAS domain-containing sensor histidine kinase [Elusimicrobia bacterium]|nr:PAS domain-containing sensor histidine kinase [Elusimicrobiota bacterium]